MWLHGLFYDRTWCELTLCKHEVTVFASLNPRVNKIYVHLLYWHCALYLQTFTKYITLYFRHANPYLIITNRIHYFVYIMYYINQQKYLLLCGTCYYTITSNIFQFYTTCVVHAVAMTSPPVHSSAFQMRKLELR